MKPVVTALLGASSLDDVMNSSMPLIKGAEADQ